MLAYRRADGFNGGCVTLPHSELAEWCSRKNTFLAARARAVESGLMTIAKAPTKAMPRKGRGPKPTIYQLAIGPFSATYLTAQIGPLSATPEALQAGAVGACDSSWDAGGTNGTHETHAEPNGFSS